ncbi:cadherin-87A-like [Lineus longissimus]|uniref:cadherin-87A-like n=1 Tax=Lineus longissimus TaxID=88925 RepID=UPI002B4CFFEE
MKGLSGFGLATTLLLAILGHASGRVTFTTRLCRISGLSESTPIGTSIIAIEAHHDRGLRVQFELENTDAFSIIRVRYSNTGGSIVIIGPQRRLDYEEDNKLSFVVKAFVSANDFDQLSCSVLLQDENDELPYFTKQTYLTYLPENPANGTVVFPIIEVKDKDFSNAPLRVECEKTAQSVADLKPGHLHPCDIFSIVTIRRSNQDWLGKVIVPNGNLIDYEKFKKSGSSQTTRAIYSIPVKAFDGKNNNTEALLVEITDQQDKPPVIDPSHAIKSVKENVAIGYNVYDIVAADGDTGAPRQLCYHIISGTGKDYLIISDERKPAITISQHLDRETIGNSISVLFKVSEVIPATNKCGTGADEVATGTLQVNIVDVNDNAPYFDPDRMVIKMSESQDVNSDITDPSIKSFDKDTGDYGRYVVSITRNNDIFGITNPNVSQSGIHYIKLKKKLDYDDPNTPKTYILPLLAKETSPNYKTGTASVTIMLTDSNDNTPVFGKSYEKAIPEDTPMNTSIITVSATDKDSGAFGQDGIVYKLEGIGEEKFHMDPKTGVVSVADCSPDKPGSGKCIDYEETREYRLTVFANNVGGQAITPLKIIILDVNDNRPYCVRPSYESDMLETSLYPDPPLVVAAKDADSNKNGNNAIQYSIISGNAASYFDISSTGNITARNLIDFESAPNGGVFRMIVQVRDAKFSSQCQAVVTLLDVNDNTPAFDNLNYEQSIPETTPPGTFVLTVSASDKDLKTSSNGKIRYRIELGAAGKFQIDPLLGNITVTGGASFDYDNKKQYLMKVVAKDLGFPAKTGTTSVTINILDRNNKSPLLLPSTIRESILENATVGTCLTTLKAQDPDSNASLVYDFDLSRMKAYLAGRVQVNKTPAFDFTKLIGLNRTTGVVCTTLPLDYEKAAELEIPIVVTDIAAPTLQTGTGTLYLRILDINEHDPVFIDTEKLSFPHYNITLQEELPLNTFVVTMVATDVDSPQISAYKMIDDDNGFFGIQTRTGVVTIKKRVDYEKIKKLQFSVMAYDVGVPIRSASATVFVSVINMNDNVPQFNQSDYRSVIQEHSPEGTYVTTVSASDLDSGDYGVVRFSMTDPRFVVDNITGVITVAKGAVLDRELTPVINVKVAAWDSPLKAQGRNFNYVSVVITLLDINDHPPKFDEQNYYAQITENIPITSSVLQLRATDGDKTCNCINAQIKYTKIPNTGDVKDFFNVNGTTGRITVNKSLIGESYSHRFNVMARDGFGSGKFSVSASVTISVIDANNKPPVFVHPPLGNYTISVLENQYRGLLVYRVRAKDPDSDLNSPITYGFRVNNKMVEKTNEFRINNITGQIRAQRVFDREETDKYLLHVSAADHGVPSFVTTIDLVVLILDVDDNLPEFPRFRNGSVLPYQFSVGEDARPGSLVGIIEATDKDTKASTAIKYSIVNGNIRDTFRIENRDNKGYIYINKIVDREDISNFELLCRASNRATSFSLNTGRKKRAVEDASATVVKILVTDVNDNAPQFELPDYRSCVTVDAPFGKPILDVKAHDKDTGQAGRVFYMLRDIKNIRQDGQSTQRQKAFIVSQLNGTIYTNALYNQDGKSYFDMQVVGYNNDSTKTEGTSSARVYVTESATRVKVSINRSPDEVNRYIKDYKRVIAESLKSKVVCVEATRYHINAENIIEVDKADLIVHVVDMNQNSIYPASDVVEMMKAASEKALLSDYKVLFIFDINPVEVKESEMTLHPVFIIMCIIVVILIVALVLLGLICFFLNRQYKREMRKAKYVNDGPMASTPGGTVNPLWKERMDKDSGVFVNKAYEPDM